MWGDLATDTGRLVDVDQVRDGLGVDGQLALCTDDLGAFVLVSNFRSLYSMI